MTARPQRNRRSEGPIAALLDAAETVGAGPDAGGRVLLSRSAADDSERVVGIAAEIIEDAMLARVVRERGVGIEVLITAQVDTALMRVLRDRMPPLVILTGPGGQAEPELVALAAGQGTQILGPNAVIRVGPSEVAGTPTPIACAGHLDELRRLLEAIGPTRLALAPSPRWLPQWLMRPALLAHDLVGYLPAAALDLGWIEWLETLGPRELRQLLVPLGVPQIELDPFAPQLEAATVAHHLERLTGPIYPAPQVLALLREAARVEFEAQRDAQRGGAPSGSAQDPSAPATEPEFDEAAALELWDQARRALPRIGELIGMQSPDPSLSLRVPTAAFLAQRGLLRLRTSASILFARFEGPDHPDPDLVDRADVVLEGAAEVLSDQESKVVLRGHGVEVTRQAFANSASGAASFADKIGYPVALKALSPELRRKRELGALALDVVNAAAVKRAYADIIANVEEQAPTIQLDGVVVAEMIEPGLDLRCGGVRTRSGRVSLFVQALTDARVEPVLAASPLSEADAQLLAEAALAHVPLPARRRASDPDTSVLARLLLRIDGLFRHTGERLVCVDLSPVRLVDSERRYVTLDARIVQRPHLEGV